MMLPFGKFFAKCTRLTNHLSKAGRYVNSHLLTRVCFRIQRAHLTSTGGKQVEQHPNNNGYFTKIARLLGKTPDVSKLFNDNSKIIVVEGNIATGKTEFAKKLSVEFGMSYVAEAPETQVFWYPERWCDIRNANEVLPEGKKFVGLEEFYTSSNPKEIGIGRTQVMMLKCRMDNYCYASSHLFNTGQGVVIDKSVYCDFVYAAALYNMGYISLKALELYDEIYKFLLSPIWRPHIIIYLGAPVTYIQEQIKHRAIPYEVGSKVLTDKYITLIDSLYRHFLHNQMKANCEILEYDASNLPEWKKIVEDLEKLDLTPPIIGQENKFREWNITVGKDAKNYRKYINNGPKNYSYEFYKKWLPRCWECEESEQLMTIVDNFLSDKHDKF